MATTLVPRTAKMNNLLICPVCLGDFEDPVIISCHHSFCRSCLARWIDSNQTSSRTFKCPVCKANNLMPRNGAVNFQKSFVVEQVRDALSATQSDTNSDNADTDRSIRVQEKYPECMTHPSEDLRFFCKHCEIIICRDCKVTSHDGHQTQMAHEKATELKCQLKELVQNVDADIEMFTLIRNRHRTDNTNLQALKEKGIHDLQNQLEVVQDKLDTIVKQLKKTYTGYFKDPSDRIKNKVLQSEATLQTFTKFRTCLMRLITIGNDIEVIANNKAMSEKYANMKVNNYSDIVKAEKIESLSNLYQVGEIKDEELRSMIGTVFSPLDLDPAATILHKVQSCRPKRLQGLFELLPTGLKRFDKFNKP